jgi:hypothetical protein
MTNNETKPPVGKLVHWLFNFGPETGELLMGVLALRYAWLIGHPERAIADSTTVSVMQKVLKVAFPLPYWMMALAIVGFWQLLSLALDYKIGRKSIRLRKKSVCAAMITWGLVSYSYFRSGQPIILSITFTIFAFFCLFLILLLRRIENIMEKRGDVGG